VDDRTVAWGVDGAPPGIHDGRQVLKLRNSLVAPLNESSLALVVLDADERFVRVNAAACQFFGRTHDDLLGRSATELLVGEFAPENGTGPELGGIDSEPSSDAEWRVQRPDGSVVWGRVRSMDVGSVAFAAI